MAYAAMTSDTIRRDGQEERRLAQEAREHAQKIPDNYRKLLFSEDDTEKVKEHYTNPSYITPHAPSANAAIERAPAPVQTARPAAQPQPSAPAHIYADPVTAAQARTAQRLADYIPYESNKNKRVLFDNITYKDYEIVEKQPAASVAAPAPLTRTAPVYAPVTAPVTAPAEDDAMPTARTMGTLQRASVRTAEAEGQAGVRSVLSLRAKIVLGAIAAAIVLFIALICVNTGILSAANAEAAAKEARLQELRETYAEMQEDLDYLMSDEYIDAWAEANGMIRGN